MSQDHSGRERASFNWQVGWSATEEGDPVEFVPAVVPGAVQLDWAKSRGWAPYWMGDNWKEYGWMEDVFWTYRTVLDFSTSPQASRRFLVFKGVDYRFKIFLSGTLLHEQEGMFTPVELELPGRAKDGDVLTVKIFPAPKSRSLPVDRSQADHSCKPAVSYGWDFHPRLIPLGIWDEAGLEFREGPYLDVTEVSSRLADDFSRVDLTLETGILGGEAAGLRWSILDLQNTTVLEREISISAGRIAVEACLENPLLWWPHDQGEPVLYRSQVQILLQDGSVGEVQEKKIGFRRIRLVMHEGAWDWPEIFPKSRSTPPMTLEVNGRVIFAKGANWVSPEIFPGLLCRESIAPQLQLAKQANMNLLRMWGGAVVQKEHFYDLCDELGILVWQEFPLACNNYNGGEKYLRVLDRESKSIVQRLRSHACLAMWCGGNELFNAWSGMTEQSPALRLLNRNCFDLDPETPFLMTSPLDGVGHGHYVFRDPENGQEAWNVFQQASNTAYCEFGCPGPAAVEVLEKFIPAGELFPPRPGTVWETHHAFGVWMKSSHLYPEVTEHYFGPTESLDDLVDRGQLLQAEGYKGLFEEARRQKPKSSMALCWCLNEPWPSAANNSLISWPCKPKPALAAVGEACRPILASARVRQFEWREGDLFDPELWFLSDSPQMWDGGEIRVWIENAGSVIPLMTWPVPVLAASTNGRGPRIQFVLPDLAAEIFYLVLHSEGRPDISSRYALKYCREKRKKKNPRSMN